MNQPEQQQTQPANSARITMVMPDVVDVVKHIRIDLKNTSRQKDNYAVDGVKSCGGLLIITPNVLHMYRRGGKSVKMVVADEFQCDYKRYSLETGPLDAQRE